jgi:hypothetical protein
MNDQTTHDTNRHVILAFYPDQERARKALDSLIDRDFPLDRISLLGKATGSGDDPLGVYYPTPAERMRAWGGMGAFWGGLWGLLTGAAGMFLIPGVGPVMAAGPIVEALVSGAAGAGIGAGVMAGGAAASQLTVAAHRMGVPEDRLEETQRLLDENHTLMLLIVGSDETGRWRDALAPTDPDPFWDYPYLGLVEGLGEAVADRD